MQTRGATCSGKTILAKHLVQIFDATVLHQDDYAPVCLNPEP